MAESSFISGPALSFCKALLAEDKNEMLIEWGVSGALGKQLRIFYPTQRAGMGPEAWEDIHFHCRAKGFELVSPEWQLAIV